MHIGVPRESDPGQRLVAATPQTVEKLVALGYDVIVEGDSHGEFGTVRPPVEQWADAGATWWVESWWDLPDSPEGRAELRRRLELGPPRT